MLEDDEDEGFCLPCMDDIQATHTIGETAAEWLQQFISKQQVIYRPDYCLVWIKGHYIRAHKGTIIALLGSGLTIFELETSH